MRRIPFSPRTRRRLAEALREDVGGGDWTSRWSLPPASRSRGTIIARRGGILCGLPAARVVFSCADRGLRFRPLRAEGAEVRAGSRVALVSGRTAAILAGERAALNVLMHLSGVATLTRAFVRVVAGTRCRIYDTRKTTPLWRELERYAVRVGGGHNHRRGLDAAVLIKENHIAAAGGVQPALDRVRRRNRRRLPVEIEVRTLREFREALAAGAPAILLDHWTPAALGRARSLLTAGARRPLLEATGGMTPARARRMAVAGVDRVSVGALTHSAPAIDMTLLLEGVDP